MCQWRPDKAQHALGGGGQQKLLGVLEVELAMENELGFDYRKEEEEQSLMGAFMKWKKGKTVGISRLSKQSERILGHQGTSRGH